MQYNSILKVFLKEQRQSKFKAVYWNALVVVINLLIVLLLTFAGTASISTYIINGLFAPGISIFAIWFTYSQFKKRLTFINCITKYNIYPTPEIIENDFYGGPNYVLSDISHLPENIELEGILFIKDSTLKSIKNIKSSSLDIENCPNLHTIENVDVRRINLYKNTFIQEFPIELKDKLNDHDGRTMKQLIRKSKLSKIKVN